MITAERNVAIKRLVRSIVGEPYVGKRMKLRYLNKLMRELRLQNVEEILEVGCGDGLFSEWIQQQFPKARVTALDIDTENINALAKSITRVSFVEQDILEMNISNRFDLVIALDVLEHIKNDVLAMKRIFESLRSGGTLIIHVPNRIYRTITGEVHDIKDEDAWKINPGHVRHGYVPEDLRVKLESVGFNVTYLETAHGEYADLAHRVYDKFENPAPLRLLAIPLIDVISFADRRLPRKFGNTVLAVASKP